MFQKNIIMLKICKVTIVFRNFFNKRKEMQDSAGYGTIIRQEISERSARVALTIGDAARAFRLI